ncbi:hypothetical protein [Streptomyces deccanensis]|uniref:hypothetical protein n=1 Tax=Streptomyces deccanensis TaxID=424188 RepID=UPI001EFB1794|nr:hypothetical protein [Streptomyces deccanensis]ULR50598.1 hypothetical protein L3078_15525 [Streptomyces deccanensis]
MKRTTLSRPTASRPDIAARIAAALAHPVDPFDAHPALPVAPGIDTATCGDCSAPATTTFTGLDDITFGLCADCDQRRADIVRANSASTPAVQAAARAEAAIAEAMRLRLDGLTTNPRDTAEQLIRAVEGAQAEHLARPDVGGFPIDQARGSEAFGTAHAAMERALRLSDDPAETARGLRWLLGELTREARA